MIKTVVVLDNQVVARHMLRFALELQQYRVVEAENGAAALNVLASRDPALLVLGVNPAADDNCALVAELRRRHDLGALPILLVGAAHCRAAWDMRSIGNCLWLDKPFRVGELHGAVESLLGIQPPAERARRPCSADAAQRVTGNV